MTFQVNPETRRYAAVLVRRHFAGTVTLEALAEHFAHVEDPLILATLDLVARQPDRGFLGESQRHWDRVYWPRVARLIAELEKGEAGIAPPCPIYPVASLPRILGMILVTLYIGAVAAEDWVKLWRHLAGTEPLATWELVMSSAGAFVLSVCAIGFARAIHFRISLFRGQRAFSRAHHPMRSIE